MCISVEGTGGLAKWQKHSTVNEMCCNHWSLHDLSAIVNLKATVQVKSDFTKLFGNLYASM